jgi:FkbM family methyltransferase
MAEEMSSYESAGWTTITWIEAQPKLARFIKDLIATKSKQRCLSAALDNLSGKNVKLKIASNSGSSSLLDFGTHATSYPDINMIDEIELLSTRLDDLVTPEEMPNYVCLDVQGVELRVLEGFGSLLGYVDYIYLEVNVKEVYLGCSRLSEINDFMKRSGFRRVGTRIYLRHGWGEALYVRNHIDIPISFLPQRLWDGIQFYWIQVKNLLRKPLFWLRK